GEHFRAIARPREDFIADALESRADARVSGAVACPRERLVLPRPRAIGLVVAKGRERAHEQSRGAVGPQTKVRLVEHAGRGVAREPRVEALGDAREAIEARAAALVVEKDDVEVRAVAELL